MMRVGFHVKSLLVFSSVLVFQMEMGAASSQPPPDDALRTLEAIFQDEKATLLKQLVSPERKTYLSSPGLDINDGYYSGDQVLLLFQDAFRFRTSVRFSFLKGADPPPEAGRVQAVARWTYRQGKSKDRTVQLAFTLIRREGGWLLKEIREIP